MYKSMFRPEVIRRSNCASSDLAKLPSLPRTSEIHHVVIPAERSTSVYINLVRCVYHCFTFSLVLGVSPIAIVVCLINIRTYMQLRSPEVTRVNFHLSVCVCVCVYVCLVSQRVLVKKEIREPNEPNDGKVAQSS